MTENKYIVPRSYMFGDYIRNNVRKTAGQAMAIKKHSLDAQTAREGTELTDEQWAALTVSRIYDEAPLMQLFNMAESTSREFNIPALTQRLTGQIRKTPAADFNDAGLTPNTLPANFTENRKITMIPVTQRIPVDNQLLDYAADGNIQDRITENMIAALGDDITNALLNGDTRTTAQNNVNNVAGNTTTSPTGAFYGIRAMSASPAATPGANMPAVPTATAPAGSFNAGVSKFDGGTLNFETWLKARAKLKAYRRNPADLITIQNWDCAALYEGFDEVITLNHYGPNAIILSGELMKLGQSTFLATDQLPDRVTDQDVISGTSSQNNKLASYIIHGPSQWVGQNARNRMRFQVKDELRHYGKEMSASTEVGFNTATPLSFVTIRNISP